MNSWTHRILGIALPLSVVSALASPLAAHAQRAADPDALARAQNASLQPMRWIIENSKIERKKPAAAAASTPSEAEVARVDAAAKPKRKAAAAPVAPPAQPVVARTEPSGAPANTVPATPTRSAAAEHAAPVADKVSMVAAPAVLPAPVAALPAAQGNTAKPDVAAVPPAAVAKFAPVTVPAAAPVAAAKPAPAAAPVAAAKPAAVPAPAPAVASVDDQEELVVVSQAPPQVWSGLCTDGCGKYFYRVAFKVEPNGKVDQVRVIETNYPKFKFLVLRAVAEWQYRPVRTARDEEVMIRLAEQ